MNLFDNKTIFKNSFQQLNPIPLYFQIIDSSLSDQNFQNFQSY
jgi:hypothetical protein